VCDYLTRDIEEYNLSPRQLRQLRFPSSLSKWQSKLRPRPLATKQQLKLLNYHYYFITTVIIAAYKVGCVVTINCIPCCNSRRKCGGWLRWLVDITFSKWGQIWESKMWIWKSKVAVCRETVIIMSRTSKASTGSWVLSASLENWKACSTSHHIQFLSISGEYGSLVDLDRSMLGRSVLERLLCRR